MPRIPVRTEPYASPSRQHRHFKNKRDQVLRALGKSAYINGSHFAIMWVTAAGQAETYASDAFQGRLEDWFETSGIRDEGVKLVLQRNGKKGQSSSSELSSLGVDLGDDGDDDDDEDDDDDDDVEDDIEDLEDVGSPSVSASRPSSRRSSLRRASKTPIIACEDDRADHVAASGAGPLGNSDAHTQSGLSGQAARTIHAQAGSSSSSPFGLAASRSARKPLAPLDTNSTNKQFSQQLLAVPSKADGFNAVDENFIRAPMSAPLPRPSIRSQLLHRSGNSHSQQGSSSSKLKQVVLPNREARTQFFELRFSQMQQGMCKTVAKAWIKIIEPKKQTRCPYNKGEEGKPEWWPAGVRHKEPDHLMKPERHELLLTILRSPKIKVARLQLATAEVVAMIRADKVDLLMDIYRIAREEERLREARADTADSESISVGVSTLDGWKASSNSRIPSTSEEADADATTNPRSRANGSEERGPKKRSLSQTSRGTLVEKKLKREDGAENVVLNAIHRRVASGMHRSISHQQLSTIAEGSGSSSPQTAPMMAHSWSQPQDLNAKAALRRHLAASAPGAQSAQGATMAANAARPFDASAARPYDASAARPYDASAARPYDASAARPYDASSGLAYPPHHINPAHHHPPSGHPAHLGHDASQYATSTLANENGQYDGHYNANYDASALPQTSAYHNGSGDGSHSSSPAIGQSPTTVAQQSGAASYAQLQLQQGQQAARYPRHQTYSSSSSMEASPMFQHQQQYSADAHAHHQGGAASQLVGATQAGHVGATNVDPQQAVEFLAFDNSAPPPQGQQQAFEIAPHDNSSGGALGLHLPPGAEMSWTGGFAGDFGWPSSNDPQRQRSQHSNGQHNEQAALYNREALYSREAPYYPHFADESGSTSAGDLSFASSNGPATPQHHQQQHHHQPMYTHHPMGMPKASAFAQQQDYMSQMYPAPTTRRGPNNFAPAMTEWP